MAKKLNIRFVVKTLKVEEIIFKAVVLNMIDKNGKRF